MHTKSFDSDRADFSDFTEQVKSGILPAWNNPKVVNLPNLPSEPVKNIFASIPRVDIAALLNKEASG